MSSADNAAVKPNAVFFKSERELQEELTRIDFRLDGPHTVTFLRREVPVNGCIPDLILVRFLKTPDPCLWPSRWTFRHSFAIWLLRQFSKLTLEEIAAKFYELPNGPLRGTIRELVKSGAVVEIESRTFALSGEMANVKAEVIAVEAKLSRWQEAIRQAQVYMQFADRVFVAMDAYLVPRAPEKLERFCELGIGLCAVLPSKLNWLVYPSYNKKGFGAEREYLIASAASSSRQTLWSLR